MMSLRPFWVGPQLGPQLGFFPVSSEPVKEFNWQVNGSFVLWSKVEKVHVCVLECSPQWLWGGALPLRAGARVELSALRPLGRSVSGAQRPAQSRARAPAAVWNRAAGRGASAPEVLVWGTRFKRSAGGTLWASKNSSGTEGKRKQEGSSLLSKFCSYFLGTFLGFVDDSMKTNKGESTDLCKKKKKKS